MYYLKREVVLFNLDVLHETGDPGRGKILFQSMDSVSSLESAPSFAIVAATADAEYRARET